MPATIFEMKDTRSLFLHVKKTAINTDIGILKLLQSLIRFRLVNLYIVDAFCSSCLA